MRLKFPTEKPDAPSGCNSFPFLICLEEHSVSNGLSGFPRKGGETIACGAIVRKRNRSFSKCAAADVHFDFRPMRS
jgi:hypothetical protein